MEGVDVCTEDWDGQVEAEKAEDEVDYCDVAVGERDVEDCWEEKS